MSRRGRPPLRPEQRRCVPLTVWVRPDVADGIFLMMGRSRRHLSEWASAQFERLIQRERELRASQISDPR